MVFVCVGWGVRGGAAGRRCCDFAKFGAGEGPRTSKHLIFSAVSQGTDVKKVVSDRLLENPTIQPSIFNPM